MMQLFTSLGSRVLHPIHVPPIRMASSEYCSFRFDAFRFGPSPSAAAQLLLTSSAQWSRSLTGAPL